MPEFRASEISGIQKHLFPDRMLATLPLAWRAAARSAHAR
jgi:hypothetical protein